MRRISVVVSSLLVASAAFSQTSTEFAPFGLLDDNHNIIVLNGGIDPRTPLTFKRVLAARPHASILVLNSPGGHVQSALLMAEEVFERKISTLILEDSGCYSACSFVYFAGVERVAEGELGVHQISGSADVQSAQLSLSDVIEYLNRYGVSAEVITRMLRTPPDEMYVFSQAEIAALGINRVAEEDRQVPDIPQQAPAAPSIAATPPSTRPLEQPTFSPRREDMAQAFVLGLIMSGSLPKNDLIATAKNAYADNVTFYGKVLSQADVLADKARYADRWPVRIATARVPTIQTQCDGQVCRVTGLYDWSVSDPGRKASAKGSAHFEYLIDLSAGYKVIGENGKVLDRN